jgi:hypothetical protein
MTHGNRSIHGNRGLANYMMALSNQCKLLLRGKDAGWA